MNDARSDGALIEHLQSIVQIILATLVSSNIGIRRMSFKKNLCLIDAFIDMTLHVRGTC
jgi:hypothetical protein